MDAKRRLSEGFMNFYTWKKVGFSKVDISVKQCLVQVS